MEKKNDVWVVKLTECMEIGGGSTSQEFSAPKLAEILAKNWCHHREAWRNYHDDLIWWHANTEVYFHVLYPGGRKINHLAIPSPEIMLAVFKERLFAIRFGSPELGNGPSRWEFIYHRGDDFRACQPANVFVNQASGKLAMSDTDITFSPEDGIWPWPVAFPNKFLTWGKLATLLTVEDGNPLTGLLANNKKDPNPTARVCAIQAQRILDDIKSNWAKEIIEAL